MAGVIAPHSRRGRKPVATATATAPVEPAIAASAERAAIERDPAIAVDPAATPAIDPQLAAEAPIDGAVLPEPTLVAEPGAPPPIVTAAPILAVEPAAIDVVEAEAAAARAAAGIDPAVDPAGPHSAAAGQPTLTIEESGAERAANRIAGGADVARVDWSPLTRAPHAIMTPVNPADTVRVGEDRPAISIPSTIELLDELDLRMARQPELRAVVRDWFGVALGRNDPSFAALDRSGAPTAGMVAIVEVVGPLQGRRRAGRSFGPQAVRFLASELSADEIAALRADPLLTVGVTDVAEADVDPALFG